MVSVPGAALFNRFFGGPKEITKLQAASKVSKGKIDLSKYGIYGRSMAGGRKGQQDSFGARLTKGNIVLAVADGIGRVFAGRCFFLRGHSHGDRIFPAANFGGKRIYRAPSASG